MTLLELRTLFIKRSGRIDLVGEDAGVIDYTDDQGADSFINEGIRELDGFLPHPINTKTVEEDIVAGQTSISIPDLRAPLEIWTSNGSAERWPLNKRTQYALREAYGTTFATVDSGEPYYWAIAPAANDGTPSTSMTLSILPPADAAYTLEITGRFWSPALSADADTNWWSVNHPGLVVLAALYVHEVSMRNTAGANDWLAAIERRIRSIDYDDAERSMVDFTELAG